MSKETIEKLLGATAEAGMSAKTDDFKTPLKPWRKN